MTQKKQVLCGLQVLFLLFNCQTHVLLMTGGGFGIGFGIAKIAEKISERVIDLSVSVTVGSMAGIIGFIAGNLLLLKFFDFSIE